MIRLHLLGFTPDLKGLVFSGRRGGRTGTYWLPADDTLLEALGKLEKAREEQKQAKSGKGKKAKAAPRKDAHEELDLLDILEDEGEEQEAPPVTDTQDLPLPAVRSQPASRLSPREIQQLLREGRSVKDVARTAEVDESWVERFVGPVLEEQAGVIRMTREAIQARPRLGPSGLPVGRAVIRNLEQRKATTETLDEAEEGWDARRVRSKTWRVRLRFQHRGKRRTAEWELRQDGDVVPRNKLATELGWWPPDDTPAPRPAEPEDTEPDDEEAAPKRSGARRKPPQKRKAAKRKPAARRKSTARRKPPAKRKAAAKRKTTKTRKAKPKAKPRAKAAKRSTGRGRPKKKTTKRSGTAKRSRRR